MYASPFAVSFDAVGFSNQMGQMFFHQTHQHPSRSQRDYGRTTTCIGGGGSSSSRRGCHGWIRVCVGLEWVWVGLYYIMCTSIDRCVMEMALGTLSRSRDRDPIVTIFGVSCVQFYDRWYKQQNCELFEGNIGFKKSSKLLPTARTESSCSFPQHNYLYRSTTVLFLCVRE